MFPLIVGWFFLHCSVQWKQWNFRLVECAQINPHSENAPDTGGGVTSHIEQVPWHVRIIEFINPKNPELCRFFVVSTSPTQVLGLYGQSGSITFLGRTCTDPYGKVDPKILQSYRCESSHWFKPNQKGDMNGGCFTPIFTRYVQWLFLVPLIGGLGDI